MRDRKSAIIIVEAGQIVSLLQNRLVDIFSSRAHSSALSAQYYIPIYRSYIRTIYCADVQKLLLNLDNAASDMPFLVANTRT